MKTTRLVLLAIFVVGLSTGCSNDITLPSTGTIYGDLLYADGSPAAGIAVLVEETGQAATSDDEGRFVINDVLAVDSEKMGRFYTVRGYGRNADESVGFLVDHFKVKGQQSYSVGVVIVRPTGTITGTLLLGDNTDHSGIMVRIENTSLESITHADGSFEISGIPAHKGYRLQCRHDGYEDMVIAEYWDAGEKKTIDIEPREIVLLGITTMTAQD